MTTNETSLKTLLEKRIAGDEVDQRVGEIMKLLDEIQAISQKAKLDCLDFEEMYATVRKLRSDFY